MNFDNRANPEKLQEVLNYIENNAESTEQKEVAAVVARRELKENNNEKTAEEIGEYAIFKAKMDA